MLIANELPNNNALKHDQVISNFKEKKSNHIPGDKMIPELHIEDVEAIKMIKKAKKSFDKHIKEKKIHQLVEKVVPSKPPIFKEPPQTKKIKRPKKLYIPPKKKISLSPKTVLPPRPNIRIFRVQKREETYVSLPSGSTALGTLLGGVEVSREKKSIDVRLDFAFYGPNNAVVELTGCIVWVKLWGNYNTERLEGEAYSLSCRAEDGTTFEVPIKAHIKDKKDEFLGIKAKFLTRGKAVAAALSFLRDGTKEFGQALSAAQVVTEISPGNTNGGPVKGENVLGDQSKYIAGKSISAATGRFLDWWVNFYMSLDPTQAVPPGTKAFLTTEGEILIPRKFFKPVKLSNISHRTNTNGPHSVPSFKE